MAVIMKPTGYGHYYLNGYIYGAPSDPLDSPTPYMAGEVFADNYGIRYASGFVARSSFSCDRIDILLRRYLGSPVGAIYLDIYESDGTGDPRVGSLKGTFTGVSPTSTTYQWRSMTGSTLSFTSGNYYSMVVRKGDEGSNRVCIGFPAGGYGYLDEATLRVWKYASGAWATYYYIAGRIGSLFTYRMYNSGVLQQCYPDLESDDGSEHVARWFCLRQTSKDSFAVYAAGSTNWKYRSYTMSAHGLPPGTSIGVVRVYTRTMNWGSGSTSVYFGFYDYGKTGSYEEAYHNCDGIWRDYVDEYTTNPFTGQPWVAEDLDTMECWVRMYNNSPIPALSYIYFELDNVYYPPTVTTGAATNVKSTSATGNGNITDIGDAPVTAHGVCWNKTGTPTIADSHTDEGAAGVGAFTSEMTGLDVGDLYYYRAYATNSYGTAYGSEQTFTPDYTVPELTTDAATDEASDSATLNGTLDDDGGQSCDCGFEWGETVAYGNTTPTQSRTIGQTFDQAISGLDPNTTYHFRAFATNGVGTSYGSDQTLTTLGITPTVTTDPASGIGQTGARLNGTLDNDGGVTCTVYFEYGLTTSYGSTSDSETGKVTGDTFNQLLYGLQPGKEYHFRAVASNIYGTTYGLDRIVHMAALSAAAMKAHNRSYPTGRSET